MFIPCWVIGSTLILFVLYVAVYALIKQNRSASMVYQAFWIIDVAYNLLTGSLIFWESPLVEGETFSARLRRHHQGPKGWRQTLAAIIRAPVNRVEPGHI